MIVVNSGLSLILRHTIGQVPELGLQVALYTNDATPSLAMEITDLFEPTAITGYESVPLTADSWTGLTTGGVASYTHATVAFTFGPNPGTTRIFGWHILDIVSGKLVAAEKFDQPYPIPAEGGRLRIVPQLTLRNLT